MSHLLIEFDLAGAEWVVVAYLSQDPNMLQVVESGKSPHIVTGALISGAPEDIVLQDHKVIGSHTDPTIIARLRRSLTYPDRVFLPRVMSIRQAGKKSNHGLNYDMRYRRFALENEMMEGDAEPIVSMYREKAYPLVFKEWHPAIRKEMKDNNRTLTNCFGRRVRLLDEWDQELFMAAYSFKPQSTVFDCVRTGMKKAFDDTSPPFQGMKLGAQVHDSLMVNYPVPSSLQEWQNLAIFMMTMAGDYMRPQLVYNERPFFLGCDAKIGLSWGRMHSLSIQKDIDSMVNTVQQVFSEVSEEEKRLRSLDPVSAVLEAAEEEAA